MWKNLSVVAMRWLVNPMRVLKQLLQRKILSVPELASNIGKWQARLQDVPVVDHGLVLFMQAARWADDIRIRDKAQNRPSWHYINWPFKPAGQPDSPTNQQSRAGEHPNGTR